MTDLEHERRPGLACGALRTAARVVGPMLAAALVAGCGDAGGESGVKGIDESFLDRSVSPCTDFYQFACGTWVAEHPTDRSIAIARFYEADERTSWLLERILEDDQKGTPYVPHASSQRLGDYYRACMTLRSAPAVEHASIDERIAEIRSATSRADLAQVVARLHGDGIRALFQFGVETDPGAPTRRLAYFSAGGMSLPDRRYYFDATMSVIPQYEAHVRQMTALFPTPLAIDSAAVIFVESTLAKNLDADDNSGDPIAAYNLLSFDAFTAISSFPWAEYLRVAGFPPLAEVNVHHPVYLMKLDALWSSVSLDEMKSYLLWCILETYGQSMGRDVVAEEARFHRGVFSGDPAPLADWWACLQSTKWALGFALSQPYVDLVFNEAERDASSALIASIKQEFRRRLETRTWIDAPTRQEALLKLDKVAEKVGAPEVWPSEPPIDPTATYQGNLRAVARWYRQDSLGALTEPVDRTQWSVLPCTTNAYYSRYRNEILFPAAILQTPFYAIGRPRALNYGVIGAVMGHELTHGFDDDGRKFDGDGKLRSWWTADTDQEFVRRSKCIADQYSSYEVLPGVHLDGEMTLGENIADLGGLKLAYAAYQASGAPESFFGSFGPDAQFFLAYAQIWCANYREEFVRSSVRTDVHAAPRFRVNGAVTNMPEFAAAFGCLTGSPMAPPQRCEVW